ncbi:hypothetical protein IQ25_02812 [Novosphingobium taihuense]|nr:hypothetical protein IQ25_02812 [Novosphingobium taihuense]
MDEKFLHWPKSVHTGAKLTLEKWTPDGGITPHINVFTSGCRVIPESVPTKLSWHSKVNPDDFLWSKVYSVSDLMRALIENLDPEAHQFEPLELVKSRHSLLEKRWFWNVLNRISSINPEKTTIEPSMLPSGARDYGRLNTSGEEYVFDAERIGSRHFWRDMHTLSPVLFCTDVAKMEFEKRNFTGAKFRRLGIAY